MPNAIKIKWISTAVLFFPQRFIYDYMRKSFLPQIWGTNTWEQFDLYVLHNAHWQLVEHFSDINVLLRAHLHENAVILHGNQTPLLAAYFTLILKIALIAYNYLGHILYSMLLQLPNPTFDVLERFTVIYCVDDDYARYPFEVCLRHIPEAFLASSIPYLQLNFFLLIVFERRNWKYFELKIDSNSRSMGYVVLLLNES